MSLVVLDNRAPETSAEPDAEKAIDAFYKLVKTSIGLLGGVDQAAIKMGIDRGDLTRALDRRGRYLTVDHIMRLGAVLRDGHPETAQRLAVAFVAPMDLLVYTRTQLTMAEMKDRLMAYLRLYPNGDQQIRDAIGPVDPCVQITAAEAVHRLRAWILRFPNGSVALRDALATPSPAGAA